MAINDNGQPTNYGVHYCDDKPSPKLEISCVIHFSFEAVLGKPPTTHLDIHQQLDKIAERLNRIDEVCDFDGPGGPNYYWGVSVEFDKVPTQKQIDRWELRLRKIVNRYATKEKK